MRNVRANSVVGIAVTMLPLPRRAAAVVFAVLVLAGLMLAGGALAQAPKLTQAEPRSFEKLKPPSVPFDIGPVIPGLREGAIPQGIAFAAEQNRLFISHDFEVGPSVLSVLENSSGRMIASVALKESAEKFHDGHVGGIAVLGDSLFIASDGRLLQYELAPLVSQEPPAAVVPVATRQCETRASFCTATADQLFVGEFAYGRQYPTDLLHHVTDRKGVKKRAWVCGYAADDLLGKPRLVLSIRQRVQGMCVAGDRVYLSVSFGRQNRSTIVVYRNPLGEAAHSVATLADGTRVPLWFLDGENFVREIDFPPMSEGIVMIGDRLAVLSESGATKYQNGGKGPLDRVLLLDVAERETAK